MRYQFDTDDLDHAKAALLLYGMYRSRAKNSPLNGLETWDRFAAYVRGACLKSTTTAEFVQEFCRKAKIDSIKPRYLSTGEAVRMPGTNELIKSDDIKDYRLHIIEQDDLMRLYNNESIYLIMLVRERIQREKMLQITEDDDDEDED